MLRRDSLLCVALAFATAALLVPGLARADDAVLASGSILFAGRAIDPRAASARIASGDDAKSRAQELFKSRPTALPATSKRIGAPCSYSSHAGRCSILSVQKTGASMQQKSIGGGPGYEGYEIKFRFAGTTPADNKLAKQTMEREHELRLANSWHPGPGFLQKYGIAAGKAFSCTLKVINKGACSPVAFEFPAIDLADYFERGS
jgi:hypothetical protein